MPWPQAACRCGASVRARMSMPVPGVNGTTMRTGLPGQAGCARARQAPKPARAPAPSESDEAAAATGRVVDHGGLLAFVGCRRSCRRPACRRRRSCASASRETTSSMRANGLSPERSCTSRRMVSGGVLRLARTTLAVAALRIASYSASASAPTPRGGELVGQADGVEDRLAGAVRAARIHRMGGVAEQGDAAEAPARQRILVDHRVGEDGLGRADQRGDVEPVEVPVGEGAGRSRRGCRARSSRAAPARRIRARRPS